MPGTWIRVPGMVLLPVMAPSGLPFERLQPLEAWSVLHFPLLPQAPFLPVRIVSRLSISPKTISRRNITVLPYQTTADSPYALIFLSDIPVLMLPPIPSRLISGVSSDSHASGVIVGH